MAESENEIVKITSAGTVTIPKQFRKHMDMQRIDKLCRSHDKDLKRQKIAARDVEEEARHQESQRAADQDQRIHYEENKGIENLTKKRSQIESEADEVRGIIGNFTEMISGIDGMVNREKEKITQFKKSLENQNST